MKLTYLLPCSTQCYISLPEPVKRNDAIKITVLRVFRDKVKIRWHSNIEHSITKCEFGLHPEKGAAIIEIEDVPNGLLDRDFEISNLKKQTKYTVFGVCLTSEAVKYSSNHVSFTTSKYGRSMIMSWCTISIVYQDFLHKAPSRFLRLHSTWVIMPPILATGNNNAI